MMTYVQAETRSCILYIATNCNIVVFMTVCIYIDIHTLQLCIMGQRNSAKKHPEALMSTDTINVEHT